MSFSQKVFKSSLLIIASTWVKRIVGIASILILARFLSPDDYGVVAIGILILRFFEVVSDTGINQYVLSRENLNKTELNTAWTLKLVSRLIVSCVLIFAASSIADFFNDQRLYNVTLVISLIPIINAFESPSLLLLARKLEYEKIAALGLTAKLLAFITTVGFAVYHQTYWALIIGDLVLASSTLVLSYFALHCKPKICFKNWRRQWGFSKWIFYKGVLGYSRSKLDVFLIGKIFSSFDLGIYSMAKQLSFMPFSMIAEPVLNIMVTAINTKKNSISDTSQALSKLLVAMVSIMVPVVCFSSIVVPLAIPIILGDKWVEAIRLIQILVFLSLTSSIISVIVAALNALELVKRTFYVDLVSFLAMGAVLIVFIDSTLIQFAFIQLLLSVSTLLVFYLVICKKVPLQLEDIIVDLLPSILGSTLCFLTYQFYMRMFPSGIVDLLIVAVLQMISFFLIYIIGSLLLSKYSDFHKNIKTMICAQLFR